MPSQNKSQPNRRNNIRLSLEANVLAAIDRAAAAAGISRTKFMVDAAEREAQSVLLDRRYFSLSSNAFAKFASAMNRVQANNPRLQKLLGNSAPWD